MPNHLECAHTIEEWQVRNLEGGIVNVGQSWQAGAGVGSGADGQDPKPANQKSGPSASGVPRQSGAADTAYPQDLNQLVAQVQWLQQRVLRLEQEIHNQAPSQGAAGPQRVEFKIQKLYVRELTGTLNIGVTSIHDGPLEWSMPFVDLPDEDAQDWRRLEAEGDEDWLTDMEP